MKTKLRTDLLEMVQQCIKDETAEKNGIFKNLQKNLDYAVRTNLLGRVYFYEILIDAMGLLPEYIQNNNEEAFKGFLRKEIEDLTHSILCSSFSILDKSGLVKLDAKANLIQKYNQIIRFIDKQHLGVQCTACEGKGIISVDEENTEWVNCDPCKGIGKIKEEQ